MGLDPNIARRNAVLAGLDGQLSPLLTDLELVPLIAGQTLHEPGEAVSTVYFPILGVVSVVADLGDDQVVETATIGREGVVGMSVFLGAAAPSERSLVQVPGQGLALDVEAFRAHLAELNGPFSGMLRRSAHALFTQVSRNAACNRVHTVRERAARWLLATADRMDGPSFELTQHFLAQMLAVRRTSVSEVARALADEGCITYTRGSITIIDRACLQARACNCYEAIRQATDDALRSA